MPEYLHPGVYVQEESSGAKPIEGASTSTAAFVGTALRGRPKRPTFVTSWTQFERVFGGFHKDHPMPLSVYQFFQNGGTRAYILRVVAGDAKPAVGTLSVEGIPGTVSLKAAGEGDWANNFEVSAAKNPLGGTTWIVKAPGNKELERFDSLDISESGDRFYASVINRDSQYIRIEADASGNFPSDATPAPAAGGGAAPAASGVATLSGGSNGTAVAASDFESTLKQLDRIDDASILVIPASANADLNKAVAVHGAGYVHARPLQGDMFYIMDSPFAPGNDEAPDQIQKAKDFVNAFSTKTSHAALYFPWVAIPDPFSKVSGATRHVPPSGMLAGLFARTDNTRGVWKAPAGTEAALLGTVGVAAQVSDAEQDTLNPIGVNCIRQFPGAGIVVWGSRTLSTQSNPEYRYVPIRRFTNFLKVSLYRGTQWVVFEPNDEPLWASIRFNLNAFMSTLFRAGALQGGKPAEAYLVKCDGENNIQATIDAGQVHILVAFAPLKPAEFVIIHIQQIRKQ